MVSVMLYPCILCVSLLVYLFVLCVACLTVFVNCLACCAYNPNERLSVPSIGFVCDFVYRKLPPHLRV